MQSLPFPRYLVPPRSKALLYVSGLLEESSLEMAARDWEVSIFLVEISKWWLFLILTSKRNSMNVLTCSPEVLQSCVLAACSSKHTTVT